MKSPEVVHMGKDSPLCKQQISLFKKMMFTTVPGEVTCRKCKRIMEGL